MGFYVVWLPLEIALIWSRSRRMDGRSIITARAAGIPRRRARDRAPSSAPSSAARSSTRCRCTVVLLVPAILIVVCFFVILFGVKESPEPTGGTLRHRRPRAHLARAHRVHRRAEPAAPRGRSDEPVVVGASSRSASCWSGRSPLWELRHDDPLIDVRMFRSPALGPVFLTAGLFGVSVLGAQAPLSTFARTDPVGLRVRARHVRASRPR